MAQNDFRRRRSPRMRGYNYRRSGAYFITICTKHRIRWFDDPGVRSIAIQCWQAIPSHFPYASLDEWVVMPDHLHGIVIIRSREYHASYGNVATLAGGTTRNRAIQQSLTSPQRHSLSVVVRSFKGSVTLECRRAGYEEFRWQRSYHDHIIWNERMMNAIRKYIIDNPDKEKRRMEGKGKGGNRGKCDGG